MRNLSIGLEDRRSITPKDTAEIDNIKGKLSAAQSAAMSLSSVLDGLERMLQRWSQHSLHNERANSGDEVESAAKIINFRNQARGYERNSVALVQKCDHASKLLEGVFNMTSQNAALELSASAADDSMTVRVITVITLVFLSFTVVAVNVPTSNGDNHANAK